MFTPRALVSKDKPQSCLVVATDQLWVGYPHCIYSFSSATSHCAHSQPFQKGCTQQQPISGWREETSSPEHPLLGKIHQESTTTVKASNPLL